MNKKVKVIISCLMVVIILMSFGLGFLTGTIVKGSNKTDSLDNNKATVSTVSPTDTTTIVTEAPTEEPTEPPVPPKNVEITDIQVEGRTLRGYGDLKDAPLSSLEDVLNSYGKNISLVAYSLDGNKALSYNADETYFSACTVKVGYLLSCCKVMEEKNIDEKTLLTYEERHYHGGSGDIRYQSYGTQYTLEQLITKCLSISDNVAYEMLMEYFGLEEYNQMVRELGCDSLALESLWGWYVQAQDYITMWNAVSEYFDTETKMAKILKNACTNTPFNYGTEALEDVEYSHKSGDNFGTYAAYHDAGIVWDKETPYIYVILTYSEGEYNDENTMHSASQIVYDLMTK